MEHTHPNLALIIVLCMMISACGSLERRTVEARNRTCGRDLTIPDIAEREKPIRIGKKSYISQEFGIALIHHSRDLAACLRETDCVLALREKQLDCDEDFIFKIRNSFLPGFFQIRPKCKLTKQEFPCMRETIDHE